MIKPEQIPDDVFVTFQQAWADPSTLSTKECIAAALNAWLGAYRVDYGGDEPPFFVLPLPQEKRDGER